MEKDNLKKVIVIAGPTASGKTAVSISIAKKLQTEIVSADSVQVYKELNIGSAKITEEEKQGIKHYMIDEIEPDTIYSMYDFKKQADIYIDEILNKGKIPMIVGGTGFYIQSLLKDLEFNDEDYDKEIQNELYDYALKNGNEKLHEMLKDIDEVSYNTLHYNNVKRVVRAIEYYKKNKVPISSHNTTEKEKEYKYDVKFVILYFEDKDLLYQRVDKRVDEMIENGLLEEVQELYEKYKDKIQKSNLTSMQAIGYKELIEYYKGEISKEEAIEKIKLNTRHLVKRQYTWFKHQVKDAIWVPVDKLNSDAQEISEYIINKIEE